MLQQLVASHRHLRIQRIDIAGNKKSCFHIFCIFLVRTRRLQNYMPRACHAFGRNHLNRRQKTFQSLCGGCMPTAKVIILKRTTSTTGRQTEPLLRKENHFGSTMLQTAKPTLQTGTDTTHPEPHCRPRPRRHDGTGQIWHAGRTVCKRWPFRLQKTMFYAAKGALLQRKTAPFRNHLIISYLQRHILSVSDRCEPARNMHTAGVFQLS